MSPAAAGAPPAGRSRTKGHFKYFSGQTGEGNGTPLQHLAWKIPWMEEPGRLQSRGSLRVGHD